MRKAPIWKFSLPPDGGRMVPVGLAAGSQTAAVEINRLVRRGQQVCGSYGARTRTDLPIVVDLAARGVLDYRGVVSERVPLYRAEETYRRLERGAVSGRAVVEMALNDRGASVEARANLQAGRFVNRFRNGSRSRHQTWRHKFWPACRNVRTSTPGGVRFCMSGRQKLW